MIFIPDSYTYAPVTPFVDGAQGNLYVYAYTHGALTAKTPYFVLVNEYGHVTAAPSAIASYCYIGVPNDSYAASTLAKLQIGGFCADVITPSLTVTVGHAFGMGGGVVTDEGVDFTGLVNEWAANCTDSSSSAATAHDMMLCGHLVLTASS
jgi:hypothetical protein